MFGRVRDVGLWALPVTMTLTTQSRHWGSLREMAASLSTEQFERLVGAEPTSPRFADFVTNLGTPPQVEHFDGGRTYYSFPNLGISFVFDNDRLTAAQLFAAGTDAGTSQFQGPLPGGISFTDSRDAVANKLGKPRKSVEGRDDARSFVRMEPWAQYAVGAISVHVTFAMDAKSVRLVSLQAAGPRP